MYTVLLVDDEPTILETFSNDILWNQFGVDTLLTASDGCQAWEIISQHHIDLLITDIQMPHMDGITLLKNVRSTFPDIHCILLSAYSDFEYARAAIQLGVENYLLKPFNRAEVEETIETALENIYSQKKISHYLFKNNVLFRWANGNITSEELSERGGLLDINLYFSEYLAVSIAKKLDNFSLSAFCKNCIQQLSNDYEAHFFKDEHKRYTMIIGGSRIQREQLISLFKKEAESFHLSDRIIFAFGNIVSNADELPESYQTASNLIGSCDFTSTDMILHPKNDDYEQDLSKLFRELQEPEKMNQLSPIVQSAICYIRTHYAEGISIQVFCTKNKINPTYLGYLFKKETGFFFNNYLTQYRICCSIPLLLDTDLKVSDIAQKVGFSYPSYYISCFRKHTGLTPTKYRITQIRM